MELNKENMKKIMLLIAFGIVACLGLLNLYRIPYFLSFIGRIFGPITLGLVVAYIFNILQKGVETRAFSALNRRFIKNWPKFRLPMSIIISLLIVVGILVLIVLIIVPNLFSTITNLSNNIPSFFNQLQNNYNSFNMNNPFFSNQLKNVHIDWTSISQILAQYSQQIASDLVGNTISLTANVFQGFITFILGFVIAVNVLIQKELLKKQMIKFLFAYLPYELTNKVLKICKLTDQAFSEFIVGQCLGAVILGALCFVGMLVFHFPFALLISVLVAILALIPILGQILSVIIGALLILTVSPIQAFWFIIFINVLLQLNGNLIFPKLVGSKMGLPVLWVLIAITIGGGAFGVVGILLSIPIFAVIHILLRENINDRLAKSQSNCKIPTE